MKKKFLIGASLVLIAGALAVWFFYFKPKPTQYKETQVKTGSITLKILATGTVQPENRLQIKSPLSGRAEIINVIEGKKVRKGEVLAWVSSTERAVLLDPKKAELHLNLGVVLKDQGHWDEALAKYDEALQIQPGHAHTLCSRSVALLSLGRFAEGWAGYEHRIGLPQFNTLSFPQPRWEGTPLAGRTLLIHCEQGFGDTLQFIRFVKPAVERAGDGKIVLAAQPELMPLLSQSGYAGLVSKEQPLPAFDVHVPLMSLPQLLGVELDTLPCETPYLAVEQARVDKWREELKKYSGFKIGIGWQGRPDFRGDRLRSISLETFAPLADVAEVRLISLQKGPGSEQLGAGLLRFDVVDLGDEIDRTGSRFMDTAAVMQSLDLVVTSDTALAHLAGALGVRVWLALSAAPDWRWMVEREDSPWYPSMRLFRQSRLDDWTDVFERMAAELRTLNGPLESV